MPSWFLLLCRVEAQYQAACLTLEGCCQGSIVLVTICLHLSDMLSFILRHRHQVCACSHTITHIRVCMCVCFWVTTLLISYVHTCTDVLSPKQQPINFRQYLRELGSCFRVLWLCNTTNCKMATHTPNHISSQLIAFLSYSIRGNGKNDCVHSIFCQINKEPTATKQTIKYLCTV